MASDVADKVRLRRAFEDHYEAVARYCHRRLPSAEANDATAEVFVVAWRKVDQMPNPEATLPWLYAIARFQVSTSRRAIRRLGALRQRIGAQPTETEPGPETVVVRRAEHEELLTALAKLRVDDQEILRLRAYERLSVAEIAAVLGCSVEAAKKRSSRAIRRLRRAAAIPDPPVADQTTRAIQEGGDG